MITYRQRIFDLLLELLSGRFPSVQTHMLYHLQINFPFANTRRHLMHHFPAVAIFAFVTRPRDNQIPRLQSGIVRPPAAQVNSPSVLHQLLDALASALLRLVRTSKLEIASSFCFAFLKFSKNSQFFFPENLVLFLFKVDFFRVSLLCRHEFQTSSIARNPCD